MFGRLSKLDIILLTLFGTVSGLYIYAPIVKDLNKTNQEKLQTEKDKSAN